MLNSMISFKFENLSILKNSFILRKYFVLVIKWIGRKNDSIFINIPQKVWCVDVGGNLFEAFFQFCLFYKS